jgi:hypothetical protein
MRRAIWWRKVLFRYAEFAVFQNIVVEKSWNHWKFKA